MSPDKELLFSCYALSRGIRSTDAKSLFRQVREAVGRRRDSWLGHHRLRQRSAQDILGADCPVVETIAHASAGLHYFPDADCICDVGGVDVKIMLLNNGRSRLPPQFAMLLRQWSVSSGNRRALQHSMNEMADALSTQRPCRNFRWDGGVFLQSDIVNQQRKGWQADEILAGLCAISR